MKFKNIEKNMKTLSLLKLITILNKFDENSECNEYYTHHHKQNYIDFQLICELIDYGDDGKKYFVENYSANHNFYEDIIKYRHDFIIELDSLKKYEVLKKYHNCDSTSFYINTNNCKHYLNVFNRIERHLQKFKKTYLILSSFFIGAISGGGAAIIYFIF